jgi:hypothetical protein
MSEPNDVSDKQIRADTVARSHSCPNCGGGLVIAAGWREIDSAFWEELDRVLRTGLLSIVSIEEGEAKQQAQRDRGDMAHFATARLLKQ